MKGLIRNLKNQAYEPIEVKVREATSNEAWGAPSSLMAEIAQATHDYNDYPLLFRMLWKRLKDYQHVLHVKKALLLTEYLIRNGSERFVRDAQHHVDDVNKLRRYKYYDDNNNDIAAPVRQTAKQVYEMLTNEDTLKSERQKATQIRGVKDAHVSSTGGYRDSSPRDRGNDGPGSARVKVRDPYDLYSNTSKELTYEEQQEADRERAEREDAERERTAQDKPQRTATKKKASESTAKASRRQDEDDGNPFEEQPAEDPFAEVAERQTKPKKVAKKPSVEAAEEPAAKPKKKPVAKRQPSAAAAAAAAPVDFDAAFQQQEEVDPFDPVANKRAGGRATDLADAFGAAPARTATRNAPAADTDFLTGQQFEALALDETQDEPDAPAGQAGRVDWGPDRSDDEADDVPNKSAPTADVWDQLTNLDNVAGKQQQKPKATSLARPGKSMAEQAQRKGSVVMLDPIDGFAQAPPAARQPSYQPANPYPAYPPQPAYGYPPQPAYGYPPQGGYPPQPYPPAAGYPPQGYPAYPPAAQQPPAGRGAPPPQNDPFAFF